jgi:hypothetical protein
MESAGAVFLPAVGYRYGTNVIYVGFNGNYWSSTPTNEYYAYFMGFNSDDLNATGNDTRDDGLSVRPVR